MTKEKYKEMVNDFVNGPLVTEDVLDKDFVKRRKLHEESLILQDYYDTMRLTIEKYLAKTYGCDKRSIENNLRFEKFVIPQGEGVLLKLVCMPALGTQLYAEVLIQKEINDE